MSKKFLLKTSAGERVVITVDSGDAMFLRNHVWCVSRSKGHLCVSRNIHGATVQLAREILGISRNKDGTFVCHVNGDDTDYRKSNLAEMSARDFCARSVAIRECRRKSKVAA